MAGSNFSWLHLSDIHVGMSEHTLWPNVSTLLLDDVERQVARVGSCDLVVFSGDLVQRGAKCEFDAFDQALGQIWKRLRSAGFDPPLFTIPGNHDLTRPDAAKSHLLALKRWFHEIHVRKGFFESPITEYRSFLFDDVFKEYLDWLRRPCVDSIVRLSSDAGLLPGDCSAELSLSEGSVGLVGLNSTWLQLDNDARERDLHVDFAQLMSVTGGNPTAWVARHTFNLLVSHQPISWLSTESESSWLTEINPTGRFDAHLTGHLHLSAISSISRGGASPRLSVQAPSLFGLEYLSDRITSRSHGYLLCRLAISTDGKRLQIWPRTSFVGESKDRKIIPDHRFDLDDDNSISYAIDDGPKAVAKAATVLSKIKSTSFGRTAEALNSFRYELFASQAHQAVRIIEQQLCVDLLRRNRAIWLGSSWGLASDEFVACVQRKLFSHRTETYRIEVADYTGQEPLVDFLDKTAVKSFSGLCEEINERGHTFLLFDGVPNGADHDYWKKVDTFSLILLDFCPQTFVIWRTLTPPRFSSMKGIVLSALDEPDCRTYIAAHEFGGYDYSNIDTVSRIFRFTDGVPSKIDNALRDAQIAGVSGLIPLHTDLITVELDAGDTHANLDAAIVEISESRDPSFRRAFALLKYLSLLPYGENFDRIQRVEGAHPFYINHARILVDRGLAETSSTNQFWSEQSEFPGRVLKVPRSVRETVRSKLKNAEASAINRKLATLYFGQNWTAGELRQAPAFRFSNPKRSTAEIVNANIIILRLISEGQQANAARGLPSAMRLASAYLSALIDGMHFRSAAAFYEDLMPLFPNGYEDEKALMQLRYGKSLRMTGQHSRAKAQLLGVKGKQHTKDAEQSLLLNLALSFEALGEPVEANAAADEVIKINKKNRSALHAQGIKIELSPASEERTRRLTRHEAVCRRRKAHVEANNIALALARERQIPTDKAQAMLANVIKAAQSNDDHYNGIRAIIDFLDLRAAGPEGFSYEEKSGLIAAYHILFAERIAPLFDRCHTLLWGVFENEGDIPNLLRLFRQSSFIWRLHGTEQKEQRYLSRLGNLVNPSLPDFHRKVPLETAYYLTRVGTKG